MKILVLGANGMLGHKLCQRLSHQFDVTGTVRGAENDAAGFRTVGRIDATDLAAVRVVVHEIDPDVVINAIGITKQVPDALDTPNTIEVNAVFPWRLAEICSNAGARLIAMSTDCVFTGQRGNYSESDPPDAQDLYGVSKRLGEPNGDNVLIIRTSMIGHEIGSSHGLLEWLLLNRHGTVSGFRNAIFSGFPTVVLADIIADILRDYPHLNGLCHVSSDPISKLDLLDLIRKEYALDVEIIPRDEPRIDRSLDSTRFREATGFRPEPWPQMIAKMASDARPEPTEVLNTD